MTDLLYSYTTTVKFLGSVLGPDYEVVLQDLSNINHSVIAIENGHISGRTIGSPLTSAVFQMLSERFLYSFPHQKNLLPYARIFSHILTQAFLY